MAVDKRAFKNALYQQFARIGKALSSPHRIEMMELLAQRERTVESLADELGLTMGNASAHLQVLREARLVEARKDGLFVHYRVADDSILGLLESLRRTAETRLAEVDRLVQSYLGDRKDMDAIGFDELDARLKAGSVILIDVRPREEYAAGHIAGALSIPHDELEGRLRELSRDQEVVAYCRGPYCVFADQAVALLKGKRRKARRLLAGFPEWKTAGRAVDVVTPGNGEPGPGGSRASGRRPRPRTRA
jgi:rhodanese-related sulfurtransferase/DNA-binding transcriptional ArsR family regulator